jgi:hypothetical protein
MIVKDLEQILSKIDAKDIKVCSSGYCTSEVNGFYFDEKDGEKVIVLTHLSVQPRMVE